MSNEQHLESLSEIKNLMERSTKFMSLSGLSGIIAGIAALLGAIMAYMRIDHHMGHIGSSRMRGGVFFEQLTMELFGIAIIVLIVSLTAGIALSMRESKKMNRPFWDKSSKLLLINMIIPLVTGGILCLLLIYHRVFILVAPMTLIFYGLALVNCSKYTVREVRYLGLLEIALGLLSAFFVGRGLIFWAIGFGVLHVFYGAIMHFKYNKNSESLSSI